MAVGPIELSLYSALTARGEKSDLVTVVHSYQQVTQLMQLTHLQLLHMHKPAVSLSQQKQPIEIEDRHFGPLNVIKSLQNRTVNRRK